MPYNLRSNKTNKLERFFDTYKEYIEKQNKYFGRNTFLNSVIFEGDKKYIGKFLSC